jgi:hypothetical protein
MQSAAAPLAALARRGSELRNRARGEGPRVPRKGVSVLVLGRVQPLHFLLRSKKSPVLTGRAQAMGRSRSRSRHCRDALENASACPTFSKKSGAACGLNQLLKRAGGRAQRDRLPVKNSWPNAIARAKRIGQSRSLALKRVARFQDVGVSVDCATSCGVATPLQQPRSRMLTNPTFNQSGWPRLALSWPM